MRVNEKDKYYLPYYFLLQKKPTLASAPIAWWCCESVREWDELYLVTKENKKVGSGNCLTKLDGLLTPHHLIPPY